MIKSFIILVFSITTCLCRSLPNDVSLPDNTEEQTVVAPVDATNDPISENTQEMSKEAGVEARSISESPEQSAESKNANSENTESNIQVRSTDDDGAVNSENTDVSVIKTNVDSDMSITSENSDVATVPDPNDSKSDEVTRTSRNSEGNGSADLKSASVETETGEDVSHINVKEQSKQAPEEDTPNQESVSEEKSQTASEEKKSTETSDSENSDEKDTQAKIASSEENSRSTSDENHTNTPETQSGVGGLIKHGADTLLSLPGNRRMFNDKNDHSSHKYDEVERHSAKAADTRMAPQEEPSLSGHQVHNNYLGGSRSSQSQYPYSPLEETNRNPPNYQNLPLKESKNADPEAASDIPFLKLIPPISSRSGYPTIPLLNPAEKLPPPLNKNLLKPVSQVLPLLNDAIRPLPLPTPQTFTPFKPLPLQSLPQTFRNFPLPPLEPLPPLPPLGRMPFKPDCVGCHNFPIQNWQPHTFQRLLPAWSRPAPNLSNMRPVNNNPNTLSVFRQAPEVIPFSDSVSGTWNMALQTAPYTVSSSARSFASGFSSF